MNRRRAATCCLLFLTPLLFPSGRAASAAVVDFKQGAPAGALRDSASLSAPPASSKGDARALRGAPPAKQPSETPAEAALRKRARRAADRYVLSNKVYFGHILARHGPEATLPGKSRFLKGFDVRAGIDFVLKSPDARIRESTEGRRGFLFEEHYRTSIGISPEKKKLKTLRVVIDEQGRVITAFPVK